MRRWTKLAFLLLSSALAVVPIAHAERRVALVIGNSAYQHTSPLDNPRSDATDVGASLARLGFNVTEGFDLDKAAFDLKVRDFAASLKGANAGLFFYAGHGLQVGGQNYLMPIDAALTSAAALDFEMVSLTAVQRVMERQATTNILFLDACRDNPLARNLARSMGTRSGEIGRGFAPVESGIGTLISFSTQPGNVALDGIGRNSPFAGALIKHLAAPTDDLSAILIDVRNDVMRATSSKQVPWEHSALTGRFYFSAVRPEPTKGLPADEMAWGLIKNTKDPAVLRRFIEQFPDSKRRAEAEQLAAGLSATAKPSVKNTAPSEAQAGKKPATANRKCFSFDGRQFCQ